MTRVLIVDDHLLLRDSLRGALTDAGIEVVGEAGDGLEGLDAALALTPDVVLMDVAMPVLDGIEATRRLLARRPDARVLILTMHADDDLLAKARRAGAAGYVLKDASVAELADAVARVAAGGTVISAGLSAAAHADDGDRWGEPPDAGLSAREAEILQLLADGASPAEVAERLFISPNTVRNHLASIYQKLAVSDRTQAVVEGLRRGLVSLTRTPSVRPATPQESLN